MMEAQLRTRRNAQEAQDYLADLLKWQDEQKQKDEDLRREPNVGKLEPDTKTDAYRGQSIHPDAFRHSSTVLPTAPRQNIRQLRHKSATALNARKNAAAHTYDHACKKWDSFDADSVLADQSDDGGGLADKKECKPASQLSGADRIKAAGTNGSTDAKEPSSPDGHLKAVQSRRLEPGVKEQESGTKAAPIRQMPTEPSTPEGWKERGNAFFRKGDWAAAKKAYTKGLEAGESSTGYANRAMASLKLGDVADAEQDCTRALALDPNYLKAWQRRAAARAASGRLLDAIDDLESALRLEPTSKAIAADRRELVKQYEAAETVQVPAVDMKITARPSTEVLAAPALSPTRSPVAGSSITDVISTREVSQPLADSLQQHCAPGRTDAELTPQPVQASPAQQPAAIAAQKPSPSRVDATRSAAEASSRAPAEGALQPLVAGQVQANGTPHEQKESSKASSGISHGSELQGGFVGSALAGKSGKQTGPTAAQPAANAQAGQQTSPAASCTQHGSEAAETKPPLQGGFLGKALSGKSRTDNAAISGEPDKQAAQAQAIQATSRVPSNEGIGNGAAAQASTQQTGGDDAALGSFTTRKGETASPADDIVAEGPPEKSTAAALQVAYRALASKPATLRPPTSGMEFEKVWKSLGADRERQAAYLRMLQPAALPSLFKQALTGPLLASMLDALLCHVITADPGFGTDFLSALSRVPRFELTAMCVPARERQRLKGLWDDAAGVMPETIVSTFVGLSRTFKL
ncbi:probable RNA polymerase II-associated protein 3 at N-terminal half [Coccomyxa sp. Obi]|nr:probable RNA polymerase II-associated protein 3 at N-terminal half [Coccomyxa sp. Obi]